MLSALAEKARLTEQIFNTVPGITCNPVQGAMYTFPRITLPQKAIDKAKVCSIHPLHPLIYSCVLTILLINKVCVSAGVGPGSRHVLLYEAVRGGRNLPGTRKWLWSERGNLPLQVSIAKLTC